MLPLVLLDLLPLFAGRRVIWCIDSAVSLSAVAVSSARAVPADKPIAAAKFRRSWAHVDIWHEFIDPAGHWSDGVSRQLWRDPFCQQYGLPTCERRLDVSWRQEDLLGIWHRAQAFPAATSCTGQ